MLKRITILLFGVAALGASGIAALHAQDTMDEIIRYREMLKEANPAELLEADGEEIWTTAAGPKNATLEQCDLGLGPGP